MPAKERPMLYSTNMVVGILEDRKAKSRRVQGLEEINETPDNWKPYPGDFYIDKKGRLFQKFYNTIGSYSTHVRCPYGQPGDILWVRETWTSISEDEITVFKADYNGEPVAWNWKPSIHMKKIHARIWLQITDIKVERLQQITEDDALAEGIIECEDGTYYNYFTQKGLRYQDGVECLLAKGSFQSLWCSINGLDSWNANPWVWVISFKVLSKTGKPSPEKISGFQSKTLLGEGLKSSPSGIVQKQVDEASLLPGTGEGKESHEAKQNSKWKQQSNKS